MSKTFIIFDEEMLHGGVSVHNQTELMLKINTVLDGIRDPIKSINLPNVSMDDGYEYNFTVNYENGETEDFKIQKINII
jgi:hypothetical protein